jgi:hypothetical protein
MRHANTRAIAEYWDSLRDGGNAPARDDMAPSELSALLGNVFILQRLDSEHAVFRLAGTGLCGLYQREFREHNFLGMWRGADRLHMTALLAAAAIAPAPGVALAGAETIDGRKLKAEIFIAPLAARNGDVDRYLGLYQPLTDADALGGRPLIRQHLIAVYPPNALAAPATRLAPAPAPAQERKRPVLRLVADNTNAPAHADSAQGGGLVA